MLSLPLFTKDEQMQFYHSSFVKSSNVNDFNDKVERLVHEVRMERPGVRRHIVGGTNSTLFSGLLPPLLRSPVGDRRLLAEQPHIVVVLFERQDSCF